MAKRREDIQVPKEFDPDACEFKTMADYDMYNKWARRNNRPIRVPTIDSGVWPVVKVKFQRFDQPENVLKAKMRTRELDWQAQLKPGCIYSLPTPAVKYLNRLAVPKYEEVAVTGNGMTRTETKQTGEISRFSCQVIDF